MSFCNFSLPYLEEVDTLDTLDSLDEFYDVDELSVCNYVTLVQSEDAPG